MDFIVAEVTALEDRELEEGVNISKGDKITVSSISGGKERKTLKVWCHSSQYEDYQEFYDVESPINIIRHKRNNG